MSDTYQNREEEFDIDGDTKNVDPFYGGKKKRRTKKSKKSKKTSRMSSYKAHGGMKKLSLSGGALEIYFNGDIKIDDASSSALTGGAPTKSGQKKITRSAKKLVGGTPHTKSSDPPSGAEKEPEHTQLGGKRRSKKAKSKVKTTTKRRKSRKSKRSMKT